MLIKASFLTLSLLALVFPEIICQFYGPHSLPGDAMSALATLTEFTERFKRDIGGNCIARCCKDMQSNINSNFPEFNHLMRESQISPHFVVTQLQFTTICEKIFSPLDHCLSTCSESQTRSILENRLSPFKYICHDVFREFYNSLPCRNSVRNETISTCLNDVCKERKGEPLHLRGAAKNLQFTNDLSGLKNPLAENCKLVSCILPCEAQIHKSRCGADVAKLMKGFVKVVFSSIEKTYKLQGLSWPRECANMAADVD